MVDFPSDLIIQDPSPRTVIDGKFEVISVIGTGGMGAVYVCKQLGIDRIVAVKVLLPEDVTDAASQARFEREAQALSQVRHKNIVAVYGFGMHGAAPYIAMERVDGKSLTALLASGQPMPLQSVVSIAAQVCEALCCAHENGIIHRDIKPSNIIVTADGGVKLIDFGLVKLSPKASIKDQELTEAGHTVGSVLYMSPEQCRAQPVDERSDVYALGCLMFHCLTGAPPFPGEHTAFVMHMQVAEPLPRLEGRAPADAQLDAMQAVLDMATAKQPERRYAGAAEMLADLQRMGRKQSVIAKHLVPPVASDSKRTPLRVKLMIPAAGIGALLAIVMLMRTAHDTAPHGMQGDHRQAIEQYRKAFEVETLQPTFRLASYEDHVRQVLGSEPWRENERIDIVNDALTPLRKLGENTKYERELENLCETAMHLANQVPLKDNAPFAANYVAFALNYAQVLQRQGQFGEAERYCRRMADALSRLRDNRIRAVALYLYADSLVDLQAVGPVDHHDYAAARDVLMSYTPAFIYRNDWGVMARLFHFRAVEIGRPADASEAWKRMDELSLPHEK